MMGQGSMGIGRENELAANYDACDRGHNVKQVQFVLAGALAPDDQAPIPSIERHSEHWLIILSPWRETSH